ncbi:hypothetical protein HG531_002193 [Fusarium graminearum]|nr:hypothetical protein HG531_002193 [Fusarium graminearum]
MEPVRALLHGAGTVMAKLSKGKQHSHSNTNETSGALARTSVGLNSRGAAGGRGGVGAVARGRGGGTSCGARSGARRSSALVARHIVGEIGHTGSCANLLGVLNSGLLALSIALLLETAGDSGEEVLVAADTLDVELATSSDAAASGVLINTGLLKDKTTD